MRGLWWSVLVVAGSGQAQAQPVVGEGLVSYSTPQSIGVEWDFAGDPDRDATVTVRYRKDGGDWQTGYPLFRVEFRGANMFAGSLLFLDAGTNYEVELSLSDPDGGGETRRERIATTPTPARPVDGPEWHVVPGDGGGSGTEADPFQGIAAADAAVAPGDTVRVHAGDYGDERLFFDTPGEAGNYVAWVADGLAELPDIRVRGDYIWIEGFAISAPNNALRNEGPSRGAVIRGNQITGCHYCIHLNDGAEAWWISDNVIAGDAVAASGDLSGEGIELSQTNGHTIAYNSISRVADGVSYPARNVDIFGNDIFETSDDGVEADNGLGNVRIWGNRIHHAHNNGITFQPMNSAPWYVIRNQVIGSGGSVLKVRDAVDRVLLAHNTFVGWDRVYQHQAGWIRNMTSRNNLWVTMTGDYFWEDTGDPDIAVNWRTDLDYDGFAGPPFDSPEFKWFGQRYASLEALQAATDIEQHAIRLGLDCFADLDVPGAPPTVIPPQVVQLAAGCEAIDRGTALPGINDGFLGEGPDLGAHEFGAPPPHYGPRPVIEEPPPVPDAGVPEPDGGGIPSDGGAPPGDLGVVDDLGLAADAEADAGADANDDAGADGSLRADGAPPNSDAQTDGPPVVELGDDASTAPPIDAGVADANGEASDGGGGCRSTGGGSLGWLGLFVVLGIRGRRQIRPVMA